MDQGRLQDVFENLTGQLGKMNVPVAVGRSLNLRLTRWTLRGRYSCLLRGPDLQLSPVQTASLQFTSGCPVNTSRRSGFDLAAGRSVDDQMTEFWLPLAIEHESLPM